MAMREIDRSGKTFVCYALDYVSKVLQMQGQTLHSAHRWLSYVFEILGIKKCILVYNIVLYIPNCLAKSYNDTIHKRRKCGKVQCW